MIHRILGWLEGFLKVRIQGQNVERFVNLCRNRGILLWQIYWNPKKGILYFRISLNNFYKLRPLARKCKVHPIVVRRYGFPFLVGKMKRRWSFCVGVLCCFCIVIFLSTRIWGISIEGQSYHTRESMLEYLETINIYGGMAGSELHCNLLEEKIRKKYKDIGWASVEQRGSKVYIRVKEVLLVTKKKKEKKGHLIASDNGVIVSIVTQKGTAKVRAKDTVKKGDILISGLVKIYGDNQELYEKDYVHAQGSVVLATTEEYRKILKKEYQKKVYTGRSRKIFEWHLFENKFFAYNPLKNLETYEKYDIIREGGQLCPSLSVRFPVSFYTKNFREVTYKKTEYSKKEAQKILKERYRDYLLKRKESGYLCQKSNIKFETENNQYTLSGTSLFYRTQDSYREIHKKNKIVYKEKKTDGNNGNGN